MRLGHRTYVRRSICVCGFSVLRDEIPLGKVYEVDEDSVRIGYTLMCGGCPRRMLVTCIGVRQTDGTFRPLPLAIFGPEVEH